MELGNELIYATSSIASYNNDIVCDVTKNNKRTIVYNVAGINVDVTKKFNNPTKTLSLNVYGKAKILGTERSIDRSINIDTDVYEKYDWHVKNGLLYVDLFEKINEAPEFNRVKKPKREEAEKSK